MACKWGLTRCTARRWPYGFGQSKNWGVVNILFRYTNKGNVHIKILITLLLLGNRMLYWNSGLQIPKSGVLKLLCFFEPQIELLSLEGINIIVLHRMIRNESMLQSLWRSNLAAFVLNSRQQLLLLHPPTPPPHLLRSIDHVCKFNDAITPHPTTPSVA